MTSYGASFCLRLLSLLLILGCGSSNDTSVVRVPVRGTVALDGKPLEAAIITFIGKATQGPADKITITSTALIESGAYEISQIYGPTVGLNRVEITPQAKELESYEAEKNVSGRKPVSPFWVSIPSRYNEKTTLSAEIEISETPQAFDFVLTK